MKFTQERLKIAIENSGLSYREIEERTGISHTSIYRYVHKSINKIPLSAIEKISKVTNIDLKWLIGLDDEIKEKVKKNKSRFLTYLLLLWGVYNLSEIECKKIFAKNLRNYMQINGKKQVDLINDLKYSSSTVSNWCTGQKIPRMDKIEQLAKYLGINKSDLIEEHPIESTLQNENDYNAKLIELAQTMTEDNVKKIFDYAVFLKSQEE